MNLMEVKSIFLNAHWGYMSLALVAFLISQVLSVIRFNLFIRKIGIRLTWLANGKLYLLGMFYNYFLPGGVGGDAYKVYLLHKEFKKSAKKLGQAVFVDRFLGVLAIGFLVCLLGLGIRLPEFNVWKIVVCILGLLGSFVVIRMLIRFFSYYTKRVYLGFFYSLLIQGFQMLSIIFVLKSFSVTDSYLIYLVMFLISSILSVVSFAGVGVREAVFFYGASLVQFNPDVSTSVALSFSIIGALVSFFGIIYLFNKIKVKP